MTDMVFTQAFMEWIDLLHYQLVTKDDVWVVTDHGETTYYVHHDDSSYTLNETQCSHNEDFLMSGKDAADVERYLTWLMGSPIRSLRGLPFMYHAWKPSDIRPGWSAAKSDSHWVLHDPHGDRATFHDCDDAVLYSWIADASTEDVRASYLDPNGSPLFPGCWIGPEKPESL